MIDQFYTEAELKKIFTNISRKGISDAMAGTLIKHCYNRPVNLRTSGFYYVGGPDAELSWNNGSRTITLSPFVPDPLPYDKNGDIYKPHFRFYSWYKGPVLHQKYEDESVQIPAEEGLFLIHFVLDQETRKYKLDYIKNPTVFEKAEVYVFGIPVAWIYWDATAGAASYVGDNRHGSEWNPQIHWMWHNTLNSVRETGIAIVDAIYDGDGSDDTHFQFGISGGKLSHEDINAEADAVGSGAAIPVWYMDGSVPRFLTQAGKKFLNAGRVAYSSGSGITQATNEWFVLYHLFATNCRLNQHISVVGEQYETLPLAAANVDAEVSTIRQQMPHANMMHIGSIVIQTSDDYTNSAKARIVTIMLGVQTEMSVVGDGSPINKVRLKNDEETPGPDKCYGTDESGEKGYRPFPTDTNDYVDGIALDTAALLTLSRTGVLPDITAQFALVAKTNSYNDLNDKPVIPDDTNDYVNGAVLDTNALLTLSRTGTLIDLLVQFAKVAKTGSYNDLTDKPTDNNNYVNGITLSATALLTLTRTGGLASLTAQFAAVAKTGSYNDLTDKPVIPDDTNDYVNGAVLDTNALLTLSRTGTLADLLVQFAKVAKTGSYNDLTDKPTDNNNYVSGITLSATALLTLTRTGELANLTMQFATVAKTGSYNDLADKPTIPGDNNDYVDGASLDTNALLKLTRTGAFADLNVQFAKVAKTGSYNDLSDKPTIPDDLWQNSTASGGFYYTKYVGKGVSLGKSTHTSGYVLDLDGDTISSGTFTAANFILNSERKLKADIRSIGDLSKFDKIKIHQFRYKADKEKRTRYGVIAEEVEQVAPELVYEGKNKTVAYIDLLIAKVARLEERIKELEK